MEHITLVLPIHVCICYYYVCMYKYVFTKIGNYLVLHLNYCCLMHFWYYYSCYLCYYHYFTNFHLNQCHRHHLVLNYHSCYFNLDHYLGYWAHPEAMHHPASTTLINILIVNCCYFHIPDLMINSPQSQSHHRQSCVRDFSF